ncbi:MAG TPA: hypothetical protein DEO95_04395, partial [Ruminococcaceae bacterium]|nr:hypothetical protein [Oscillospiraceae bacterium]
SPDPQPTTKKTVLSDYIYFDNSKTKWDTVYAYWWEDGYARTYDLENNDYGCVTVTNEDGTTGWNPAPFPGTAMTRIADTDIWQARIPFGATKIIFNSGKNDVQIAAGETGYQTGDLAFDAAANAGQVYVIDTSVEAKAGRGAYKTKYTYKEGAWAAYTGEFVEEEIAGEASVDPTPGTSTPTPTPGTSTPTPTPIPGGQDVKTGDATMPVAVAAVGVAALGVALFARKKKED